MAQVQKLADVKLAPVADRPADRPAVGGASRDENRTSDVISSMAATELRPWGAFTILEEGRGYKIKRIEVKPGHRLSLQMHHHRSEHWIVVSGTALVTCGGEEKLLSSNQSTYVPACTSHRLENPGVLPLVLIEVQNGEYLGEDDIIRFQDDYSRTK